MSLYSIQSNSGNFYNLEEPSCSLPIEYYYGFTHDCPSDYRWTTNASAGTTCTAEICLEYPTASASAGFSTCNIKWDLKQKYKNPTTCVE